MGALELNMSLERSAAERILRVNPSTVIILQYLHELTLSDNEAARPGGNA